MANLKELKNRIGSIKNTRKITSAMSKIAAARLRRAQDTVSAARPYGERIAEVVRNLTVGLDATELEGQHPLLSTREVKRVNLIVFTADRGLCGGFNSSITRAAQTFLAEREAEGVEVVLTAVGRKAQSFFKYRRIPVHASFDAPTVDTAVALSKRLAAESGELFGQDGSSETPGVQRVVILFNHFVNVLSQVVTEQTLLPVPMAETGEDTGPEPAYEPSRKQLLEHLLPVAVESALQQAMFDSIASEIAARRTAMDSATDNASTLIDELTLEYNRERQAAITTELMEIIGGAEALKG